MLLPLRRHTTSGTGGCGLPAGPKSGAHYTGHLIPAHLKECPWCALVRAGAANFFISVAAYRGLTGTTTGFVLSIVWERIERVPPIRQVYQRPTPQLSKPLVPNALPAHLATALPPFVPTLLPEKVAIPWPFTQKLVGFVWVGGAGFFLFGCVAGKAVLMIGAIILLVFGVWWASLEVLRRQRQSYENADYERAVEQVRREEEDRYRLEEDYRGAWQEERYRREHAVRRARSPVEDAERDLALAASRYAEAFRSIKVAITQQKHQYLNLRAEQQAELRELEKNVQQIQLRQYLDNQFINDHDIAGIGPTRKAVLRSYGIETAYDVEQLAAIRAPGFGPVLIGKLEACRGGLARQFRFDPKTGIPQSELNRVALKYQQLQQTLEQQMQTDLAHLEQLSSRAEQELSQVERRIHGSLLPLLQAEADLSFLRA